MIRRSWGMHNKLCSPKIAQLTAKNTDRIIDGELLPSCGKEETLEEANNLTTSIVPTRGMGSIEDKLCLE